LHQINKTDTNEIQQDMLRLVLSIEFRCALNNCNNERIGNLIRTAAYEKYDLWIMLANLGKPMAKYRPSNENEPISTASVSHIYAHHTDSYRLNTITTAMNLTAMKNQEDSSSSKCAASTGMVVICMLLFSNAMIVVQITFS
jgi:hypothetical protein